MIPNYRNMLRQFNAGRLNPASFSHVDHIGVAFEALDHHDFFDAVAIVSSGIQKLANKAGAPKKFNATITFAFMSLIAERKAQSDYKDAGDFIERNPDLRGGGALRPLYSEERLGSDLAKTIALLPDRGAAFAHA